MTVFLVSGPCADFNTILGILTEVGFEVVKEIGFGEVSTQSAHIFDHPSVVES